MVRNIKRTQEEAEHELLEKWPNIKMLDSYNSTHSKMKFKCSECGHEWITTFSAIIRSKRGCPHCGVKKAFKERSITYIKENLSSDFEFISYEDPMHIKVKCKNCGHIRVTSTSNLLKYGCKKCSA